jgi:Cu/Ag efflux pump CusA
MLQPLSSTGRVLMIGLSSKDVSLIDMSVLARWKIRPRLMGVPGVANVAIWGQRERQLQVQVDPGKLQGHGISLDQIVQSTANALWVSPLSFTEASTPGTGGFIDTSNQRLGIQHISPITTAGDLSRVTVEGTGSRTMRLGDVSRVVEDHQPLIGDAITDGSPGLMLVVQKFPGANTREVTQEVQAALNDMRPGLSGITVDTSLYRPADFIYTASRNLGLGLLIGLVILIVLLGALLYDWRVALISLVAIPLSLVTAGYVLYLRGVTFNTMLLAGLAIALGVVVDDAVVDVDNIRRRLRREHQRGASGDGRQSDESKFSTVLRASLEIRGPLLYATLIIGLATVPVFFVKGLTGSFARPLVISYLLAVLVSMVVALVVTPALALLLLGDAPPQRRGSPLGRLA